MNYTYYEHCYIERNYPYIPINLDCDGKYLDKVQELSRLGLVGIVLTRLDIVYFNCLVKDLDYVLKIIPIDKDLLGKSGNEYTDWLHDWLMDDFGDSEVDGERSRFGFINDWKERNRHKVIHYIVDNIDKYYKYFIRCDEDGEWIYNLYNDAERKIVSSMYDY